MNNNSLNSDQIDSLYGTDTGWPDVDDYLSV